jgi:hypothetical protein
MWTAQPPPQGVKHMDVPNPSPSLTDTQAPREGRLIHPTPSRVEGTQVKLLCGVHIGRCLRKIKCGLME